MAHTNPWTNILPLGSQQASTADDEFRKLRLDIFERMNDICIDWTADPVKLSPDAVQAALGVGGLGGYKTNTYSTYLGQVFAGAGSARFILNQLLPNDIIDQVIAFTLGGFIVTAQLQYTQLNSATINPVKSATQSATVSTTVYSTVIDNIGATVGVGLGYFVDVNVSLASTVIGLSVLFRRPI